MGLDSVSGHVPAGLAVPNEEVPVLHHLVQQNQLPRGEERGDGIGQGTVSGASVQGALYTRTQM